MSFKSSGSGVLIDDPKSKVWYHGSPLELTSLVKGSSITRNRELAKAFSHKPSQLHVDNDGLIQHNGYQKGYLYIVDEELSLDDIYSHHACRADDPWEWLIKRPLKLKLIEVNPIGE